MTLSSNGEMKSEAISSHLVNIHELRPRQVATFIKARMRDEIRTERRNGYNYHNVRKLDEKRPSCQ